MEDLIEELTKVNPSNLSEEGLKLFNKINEIIDRNGELAQESIASEATINILTNKLEKVVEENEALRLGVNPSYEQTISELEQQLFDSIPKSKVKEKLEELNKIDPDKITDISFVSVNAKIQVLKELLEEK